MFEYDEFGLFTNKKHIENFLVYLTYLYPKEFEKHQFFALPENELSFLYIIAEIFDYPLITDKQNFSELIDNVDAETTYLEDTQKATVELAYDFLDYCIKINDMRKLPLTYGVLIKNAIDILASDNDIVQFKQYEVVSIAKRYQELEYQAHNDYFFTR